MSLTKFRFHTWSRNRSHRDSGVEFFTFDETFSQFLCYWNIVMRLASEQENLCSDRLPKSAKCVFFWFPRWFPKKKKKKRNACSLLNTSYNVVTKTIYFCHANKSFSGFFGENMRSQIRPKWKQNITKQKSQRD